MAFTMHSHSGQFCPGHAKDELEDIIKYAISRGYTTMGLTEHMPRTGLEDLYPEEMDDPQASLAALFPRHDAYLVEAQRLQKLYAPQIHILIAFEGEYLRPSYGPLVLDLAAQQPGVIDYFIGSIHHVNGIPIDFDKAFYTKALQSCDGWDGMGTRQGGKRDGNGGEEVMYERYYDQQYEMLKSQKPRIVGHFDLIRLLSDEPSRKLNNNGGGGWQGVWTKILRNLEFIKSYGGWLECNTSALRKGLAEPYPCREIAEVWVGMGGRFTLSDDSHGIAQVGTNYGRALEYLEGLGVEGLWTFRKREEDGTLEDREVKIRDIKEVVGKWA